VGLGFNASGAAPSLEALVLAATRPQGHRAPKAFRDNAAVRAFAGSAARASPHGRITETHLRVAMVRFHPLSQLLRSLADNRLAPCGGQRLLESFDVVLVTEQLQRDVTRLAQLAGWRFWDVTRKDMLASSDRADAAADAAASLPAEAAAALEAHTLLDAQLYAAAVARSDAEAAGTRPRTQLRRPLRRCAALARGGVADAESAAEPLDKHAPWGVGWAGLREALTRHRSL
jgi:hypothetical protein